MTTPLTWVYDTDSSCTGRPEKRQAAVNTAFPLTNLLILLLSRLTLRSYLRKGKERHFTSNWCTERFYKSANEGCVKTQHVGGGVGGVQWLSSRRGWAPPLLACREMRAGGGRLGREIRGEWGSLREIRETNTTRLPLSHIIKSCLNIEIHIPVIKMLQYVSHAY